MTQRRISLSPKSRQKDGSSSFLRYCAMGCLFVTIGSVLVSLGMSDAPVSYLVLSMSKTNKDYYSSSSSSFALAPQQSYGFLRDISDHAWRRLQERALQAPQYKFPNFPERAYGVPIRWMIKNLQPILTCLAAERVGGFADETAFWTCDPHRFLQEAAEQQKEEMVQSSSDMSSSQTAKTALVCLVYVIGYSGAWERDLAQRFPVCEMHIFDPIVSTHPPWQQEQVHWHAWGIKSSYEPFVQQQQSKKEIIPVDAVLLTLEEIQQRLGHLEHRRHVDILKLDCGGATSWGTFQDWIALNATQILWKVNGLPSPHDANAFHPAGPLKFSIAFQQLQDYGYAMFAKSHRLSGPNLELDYVRLHPDFWIQAKEYAAMES